jgi:hypothetical protein
MSVERIGARGARLAFGRFAQEPAGPPALQLHHMTWTLLAQACSRLWAQPRANGG